MKMVLIVFGILSALLIVAQLALGQLILNGQRGLIKHHQHTGYLTVVVALIYIASSLTVIASLPRREKP